MVLNDRIRPAVHRHNGAGHVACLIGCEKNRDVRYFFRLRITAERDAFGSPGEQLSRGRSSAARFRGDSLFHAPGHSQADIACTGLPGAGIMPGRDDQGFIP